MSPSRARIAAVLSLLVAASSVGYGQVTTPQSGDNQKSTVIQSIGPVEVAITYSSPDVTSPTGQDRRGKIWGTLVPWGMADLGFGTCGKECPWRAGANENTVFSVSHDVQIEGQPLKAGRYGLHMIPGEAEWTIIFSNDSTSWGSYFYDAKEDALRVKVKPAQHAYQHWLTYEFTDRQPDKATVALRWEELEVPFTIAVPNVTDLWIAGMRRELRSEPGFDWQGWQSAAAYALDQKANLPEALTWAEKAVSLPGIGQENFTTLTTLSRAQEMNGKTAEAQATLAKAMNHPTASVFDLHALGRSLLQQGRKDEAVKVFELNAKRHQNAWPTEVGLMRGYSAVGRYKDALKNAKAALAKAPDDVNKTNLTRMVGLLEQGKDVNTN
jgi:tetratricopeptide (TPR) repeat protein